MAKEVSWGYVSLNGFVYGEIKPHIPDEWDKNGEPIYHVIAVTAAYPDTKIGRLFVHADVSHLLVERGWREE